jgi:hypothetical protein
MGSYNTIEYKCNPVVFFANVLGYLTDIGNNLSTFTWSNDS